MSRDILSGFILKPNRRRPRQRISGARVDQYRCCLPALAEFSIYRRGGTDGATIELQNWRSGIVRIIPDAHPSLCSGPTFGCPNSFQTNLSNPRVLTRPPCILFFLKLAERAGFEPAKRGLAAYTLSRRAPSTARTPLHIVRSRPRAGCARIIPDARPSLRSGPPAVVRIRSWRIRRTLEAGFSRLHTFQACSFDRSDTSPNRAVARGGLRRITGTGNAHKTKRGEPARMQPPRGGIPGADLQGSRILLRCIRASTACAWSRRPDLAQWVVAHRSSP